MYFLYLDASGDPGWPAPYGKSKRKWYVLAGLAIHQDHIPKMEKGVTSIREQYRKTKNIVLKELKYSYLVSAKSSPWDELESQERKDVADQVFKLIKSLCPTLFAIAINKASHHAKYNVPESPDSLAVRFIAPRFEKFLKRIDDKGVMVMDVCNQKIDKNVKNLISRAKRTGIVLQGMLNPDPFRTDTKLPSILESIFFSPSEDSGGIQLVDFCAYAIWKNFEEKKSRRFKEIYELFDSNQGVIYGLKIWP